MQFLHIVGTIVAQRVTFEVIPTVFIGIQFGRVSWQIRDMQAGMAIEKFTNRFPAMSIQTIPDQKHVPTQMPHQLLQKHDHLFLTNGSLGMKVQVPTQPATTRRDRDRADHRQMAVVACSRAQNRSFALGRPRSPHHGAQENACFVDPNQPALKLSCLFLIRGQSRSIQRRMAGSFRSRAWRSGFWTVKPNDFITQGM